MDENRYYRQLVKRYIEKKLTDEELEVFSHLLKENMLDEYMMEAMNQDPEIGKFCESNLTEPSRIIPIAIRAAAAAAIILIVGLGVYVFTKSNSVKVQLAGKKQYSEIVPGGDNAILTLSNGKKMVLNDQQVGELIKQNTIRITKAKDGLLIYDAGFRLSSPTNENFNTIETPRGGQYQVVLPDGTKAWLNAASSIKFPLSFGSHERRVDITGEVYFEVSKDKERPFRVASPGQVIEVLGTHFNVNAYGDEDAVRTTLLEGSVKVSGYDASHFAVLKPGQQAVIQKNSSSVLVSEADTEEAVAWKNGYFKFDGVDIRFLMRQIARWYNIEVEYRGEIPEDELVGKIRRSDDVSKVFRILKMGEVNFRLEGRKVIIGK